MNNKSRVPFDFSVVDCGPLDDPENGMMKLLSDRTTHGAFADYTCKDNYTLVGDQRRRCGDGGIWSGHKPQCLCAFFLFHTFILSYWNYNS